MTKRHWIAYRSRFNRVLMLVQETRDAIPKRCDLQGRGLQTQDARLAQLGLSRPAYKASSQIN
jgi:hypothetical protein